MMLSKRQKQESMNIEQLQASMARSF